MSEAPAEVQGALASSQPAVPKLAGVSLRIAEALLEDVDTGAVRVDACDMVRIGAMPGDVVELVGKRTTVARVLPTPLESSIPQSARLDGTMRENVRAGLDEQIAVRRVSASRAETVLLAPTEAISYGPGDLSRLRELLFGLPVVKGDRVKAVLNGRSGHYFKVASTAPDGAVFITPDTDIRLKFPDTACERPFKVKYEDIGGLGPELLRVREMVELPMKYPELFARLRIEPPKGVLLYGPPGTGKTLIAKAVASEVDAHFVHVSGPEIIHKFYGESEARLREVFEEAQRRAPSIIFLDELDAIAPKRADAVGDVEKRVVAQLLASMDGLVSRGEVVVIGATNMPELLDPALRRPGRFDREIAINAPNRVGRLRILQIHSRGMPLSADVELEKLAEVTHGFVGADIEVLCKEAGMLALRDLLSAAHAEALDATALAHSATVTMKHFLEALRGIEPTATREFFVEKPSVGWGDVGGLREARDFLLTCADWPARYADIFSRAGIHRVRGVLLSGPPGTGKTLLARAFAAETGLSLITVDAARLLSKWVGESERAVRQLFKRAKQAAPCILFFDGLDTLVPMGGDNSSVSQRLLGQLLSEVDGLSPMDEVLLLAATNRTDLVEPSLLRPGRFDHVVEVPLPDAAARREILRVHLRRMTLNVDVDLDELVQRTEGLSGADTEAICQRAAIEQMRSFIAEHQERATQAFDQGAFRLRRHYLLEALEEIVRRKEGAKGE